MNNHKDDKKKEVKPDDDLEIVLYKKPEKRKIFHGKDNE